MKSVQDFADNNPSVQKWLIEGFHDDGTREVYGWHLSSICLKLEATPDDFLKIRPNVSSPLFLKLKQHLIALSNDGHSSKALQEKAAVQNYCQFHNDQPGKFELNIKVKVKKTFERPYWALQQFNQVMRDVNPRYRPLFQIGAMVGFGRKELIYLNDHLEDLKSVPHVPDAYWINMPARKSNEDYWKAILPAKELDEFKKKGRLITSWGTPMREFNLTEQFARACKRSEMRTKGTGVHILRSVFRTVGSNANVPDKILEQNMGHMGVYDRTHEDLTKRAQALIPLWQYFREGGAPYLRKDEMAKENEELKERIKTLEKEHPDPAKVKVLEELIKTQGQELEQLQGFLKQLAEKIEYKPEQKKP